MPATWRSSSARHAFGSRQSREVDQRTGAHMADDLGGCERAKAGALDLAAVARETGQEARREEIAGAGRIHEMSIGKAGTALMPWLSTTTAPLAPRVTAASPQSCRSAATAWSKFVTS